MVLTIAILILLVIQIVALVKMLRTSIDSDMYFRYMLVAVGTPVPIWILNFMFR